mgnify:CR=1 FL=1
MARRLLLTYLTITALALAVVVVPLGVVFADREHDRLLFDIERDAQAVASLVEDALEVGVTPAIDPVLADYAISGGRIVVVDRDGVSVADSDVLGGEPRDFSTRPEIVAALDGRRTSGSRGSETVGSDLMFVAVPVASSGVVHGAVRVTFPTSTLDARVRSTWLRLGGLAAVVLLVVALVGMVFSRGVTRPLLRLQGAATRLAEGDLATRVQVDEGPPELRALAETFNTTAARLEALVESQRRFVADASHQLRTPLTALRLRLETLAPLVPEAAAPKLDAAIAETARLGRLVQSLLVLARTDASAPQREVVNLSALVEERVDAWRPVAADHGVHLEPVIPPSATVFAVDGAVEQILDNLISNALDVAPPDSPIVVQVLVRDGTTELHVVDRGPGMDAEARRHAFERFWRPDDASGDGFGLGLAIVHQLATLSGGEVELQTGPDGRGLDAVVRFRSTASDEISPAHENLNPALTST